MHAIRRIGCQAPSRAIWRCPSLHLVGDWRTVERDLREIQFFLTDPSLAANPAQLQEDWNGDNNCHVDGDVCSLHFFVQGLGMDTP